MTFVYVFGGILCGLHKVHKTSRIPSILKIWASNVWHAATGTFWPEAFYVWHSISYYAVNSHKIYLRTTHYKKTRSNYRYPKIAFYQGFLKILLPRRHSLEQRDRKGCGILSFSPILYMNLYKFFCIWTRTRLWMYIYIYTYIMRFYPKRLGSFTICGREGAKNMVQRRWFGGEREDQVSSTGQFAVSPLQRGIWRPVWFVLMSFSVYIQQRARLMTGYI